MNLRHERIAYAPEVWSTLALAWRQLASALAPRSAFLTEVWMECWWAECGPALRPVVHHWQRPDGKTCGLVVVNRQVQHYVGIPIRLACLGPVGEGFLESEHNRVLAQPDVRTAVLSDLATRLEKEGVDTLRLRGFDEDDAAALGRTAYGRYTHGYPSEDRYVDLGRLRAAGQGYIESLSRSTREQLRRSRRLYEAAFGLLEVDVLESPADKYAGLDSLIQLHAQRWTAKGVLSRFDSPGSRAFHRRLLTLEGRQADLRTLLLHVRAGAHTLGWLYLLLAGGRCHFYQSGLQYEEDSRLKPGLVAHAMAVDYCLQQGLEEYDFLAGEPETARYKASLAAGSRPLVWLDLSRPGLRPAAVHALRTLRRRLQR